MKLIQVMFAVRDDNGNPTGHIEALHLNIGGDTIAELTAGIWRPSDCPAFRYDDTRVKISRRWFSVLSYDTWVGNWCWDAAFIDVSTCTDLMNYLLKLKWHNEGGLCAFGDVWEKGKFRLSDIAALAMTDEELAERKRLRATPDMDPNQLSSPNK